MAPTEVRAESNYVLNHSIQLHKLLTDKLSVLLLVLQQFAELVSCQTSAFRDAAADPLNVHLQVSSTVFLLLSLPAPLDPLLRGTPTSSSRSDRPLEKSAAQRELPSSSAPLPTLHDLLSEDVDSRASRLTLT